MNLQVALAPVYLAILFASDCFSASKIASSTNPTCNSNLGKDVQSWFSKLGMMSSEIAKSCLNLPQADKVKALESECRKNSTRIEEHIKRVEGKLADMAKEMKNLRSKVEKGLDFALMKKIQNGMLEKNGDQCTLECITGAYALPSRTFKCSNSDYCGSQPIKCLAAKSCVEMRRSIPGAPSGVYAIFSQDGASSYDVYCDMETDGGGWTLAAVVANGDSNNWLFGDGDKDYGDYNALWENGMTLGKVDNMTNKKPNDFKSMAFIDLPAKELLISFKGKRYIQTNANCLGERSLKELFNVLRFSCQGSSYDCRYGKCLGTGGSSLSAFCHHGCDVTFSTRLPGTSSEPLTKGQTPTKVMLKSGEAEGTQDANKDRVYVSTLPARNNVDYVNGLGSFTSLSGNVKSADVSAYNDVAAETSDKTLFYGIFVR